MLYCDVNKMNNLTIILCIFCVCCCMVNAQNDAPLTELDRNCVTPQGKRGECISLHACSPLRIMLLTPPVTQDKIQLVRDFKCIGGNRYSVCCDLESITKDIPGSNCAATVSAFLPDPTSECCGTDASLINKIAGGKPTAVDQYPWLALIEYKKGNTLKTLCAGTLISGKYVLTSGVCLIGPILSVSRPINVRLGEYDTSNEGPDCIIVEGKGQDCTEGAIRIAIEETIPHPKYDPMSPVKRHDIGLVRMKEMAPYTDFIRPICLPTFNIEFKTPFMLTAAGWGAVNATHIISSIKLHVDLPFVNLEQCQQTFNSSKVNVKLSKGLICAGGQKGKDSCFGDSGGPLMFENRRTYEIVGVVSFGPILCGSENIPGVYTNVYEYNNWIRSVIAP